MSAERGTRVGGRVVASQIDRPGPAVGWQVLTGENDNSRFQTEVPFVYASSGLASILRTHRSCDRVAVTILAARTRWGISFDQNNRQ